MCVEERGEVAERCSLIDGTRVNETPERKRENCNSLFGAPLRGGLPEKRGGLFISKD